ncbi:hypothetical protein GLYMA_14G184700v4 [Glycine max]|uniref:PB1 domain-containing protein n=1 Tax=Glycine max TaxID=3847 RepID=I1MB27_SOYBN|nr:uncharacterized protein LOC100792391 [Glycine max]KAG4963781.1 hypothetical protein JHK86_040649 [Glycine max]KAG4966268.1 hypothetical protein JHK85_041243 [Glycine max]KAG5122524.1 hypothetical protein JHK84_040864 [Glycine max]KAH1095176.1 hypothetical protein GYH30_040462 [Glycine max]KAH1214246.1 hypothetical protein GmHk_14G042017 [Glycine max]|eukprot:XP_003544257.1 uncharacterized protein LOC100792391 [Glycine max]
MDSRDSSPCSRDPDAADNHHHHRRPSFDDAPPKVKLMCSFGGRIQPRPHDNHLTYVAGDTKILSVDRHVKFPSLIAKLSSLANNALSNHSFFKYQLPGEDLDALISVTNDDDLHHMMIEYDRLSRSSSRPARLRLFLFPLHNNNNNNFAPTELKSERQWFVDALNSVHVPEDSPAPPPTANPDFLFGLEKPPAEDAPAKDSECFPEDREAEPEIQNENNNEQRKMKTEEDNDNGRVYGVNGGDCFVQKNAEKVTPLVAHSHAHAHAQFVHPGSVTGTGTGTVSFMQERNNNAGYSLAVPTTGNEIYLIHTPSGMFQAVRPMTGPVGQPVYLVHAPGPVSHSELGAAVGRGGARW